MELCKVFSSEHTQKIREGRHPGLISKKYTGHGTGQYEGRSIEYYVNPTAMITKVPDVNLDFYGEHLIDTYGDRAKDYVDQMNSPSIADELKHVMAAGQGCYASYVSKFTKFEDADRYVENLMTQKHFSVFEHVDLSFFIAGISRNLLAELTRHRHTNGPSVQSQRYCDKSIYRFVLRPEYEGHINLTKRHTNNCIHGIDEYEYFSEELASVDPEFKELPAREQRFAANQSARGALPGWTETNGTWTWNIRSFLHILSLRGSKYAEPEIRRLAWILLILAKESMPVLMAPFEPVSYDFKEGWKQGLLIPHVG